MISGLLAREDIAIVYHRCIALGVQGAAKAHELGSSIVEQQIPGTGKWPLIFPPVY